MQYGINLSHEPLFKDHAGPEVLWPEMELMAGFDGEVYPCGGGSFIKDRSSGLYRFGNALEERVEEFWNNEAYRSLRISSHQDGRYLIPECRSCANLMAPNRRESHIMIWGDGQELNSSDLSLQPSLKPEPEPASPAQPVAGKTPLVSVIVPTHNRPEMLVEALQSVLNQTFQDFEILVVNDAGADVRQVVEALNGSGKITYLEHDTNRGLGAARNTGIQHARGKYIAYLDDDDRFYPEHLETLANFLESSHYLVAYTDAYQAHQRARERGSIAHTKRYWLFRRTSTPTGCW
jgi:radical SAM protein with 4Fe4S-binding SPASM domain